MDVLHLRHVTGGESKQTRCRSQGMFLLHQLSEMPMVAYSCQGAPGLRHSSHKSRGLTAGLKVLASASVVALDLCSCAGANFQQSPGGVLLGSILADRDVRIGSWEACVTDPGQPSSDSYVSSPQDTRVIFHIQSDKQTPSLPFPSHDSVAGWMKRGCKC